MIRDKQNYCIFGSFFATEKKNDCTASAKSIKSDLRVTLIFLSKRTTKSYCCVSFKTYKRDFDNNLNKISQNILKILCIC